MGVECSAPFSVMRFQVNGVYWKVVFVNPSSDDLKRDDGSITLGVCDNNVKCIYMSSALKNELFVKVLIHELTHAWIFSYGIYLTLEQEEFVCEFVSNYGRNILDMADELISMGAYKYRVV